MLSYQLRLQTTKQRALVSRAMLYNQEPTTEDPVTLELLTYFHHPA